jgi:hypothetical protein
MWYICTKEYYSFIEKNKMLLIGKWMELEIIILNEISPELSFICRI